MASFSPGSFGYAVDIGTCQFLFGFREFSFKGADLLFGHAGGGDQWVGTRPLIAHGLPVVARTYGDFTSFKG
jgi:hypothetical protein